MDISSRYAPSETEQRWYDYWENKGYFRSVPDDREPYSIVIPPPNVTGVLHMGHMLNNTVQDILIRKARLEGKNACWVPGTDHASIATEAKVVRWLREEKNLKKSDLTRDEFMEYAYQWKDKYGGIILKQLRKLGASCDWDRTSFTMDPNYYRDVIRVFVDLHEKGKLYRGLRMVNWDPEAKTVLSNEEVIYSEENAQLFHLHYRMEDGSDGIVIATQRPETIFADVAVAVNPKDERYKDIVGKNVLVPLIDRPIPVIADDYVDLEFGTGALKITPAHDPNDYEVGQRHGLEVIDTIDDEGKINENCAYKPIVGMDRFEARKAIKAPLKESEALREIESYRTNIGRSERTNCVVEPKLSLQWFVKMESLGKPALEAVLKEEVKFYPNSFQNLYRHWMENLRDWCVSRQLWWGHRIPAWYLKNEPIGNESLSFVAENAEKALEIAREKTGNPDLTADDIRQDEDVLDTWASSWLWPISVFDGFEHPDGEVSYYYPTQVVVTAWDIIYLWIARMIMAGYEYKNERPYGAVYFTGMVRDTQGRKMSKQLGNSPDALKLIEDFGADGVRYGLMSSSAAGNDILFDEKLCENGRNFCNKLWNALRLIKGWEQADEAASEADAQRNELAIRWMRERIKSVLEGLEDNFKTYRLSDALLSLYGLIWSDFCSWYLEIIKPGFEKPIDKKTYEATLDLFSDLMIALHPFMPFITEEIWHQLRNRKEGEDCIVQSYPQAGGADLELVDAFEKIKDIVAKVRDLRNQNQLKAQEPLRMGYFDSPGTKKLVALKGGTDIIQKLAVLSSFEEVDTEWENSKSFISGTDKFIVELNLEIDVEAECAKIKEELGYQQGFLKSVEKKLSNEKFVNGAPAAVVEKERQKQADALSRVEILQESLKKLGCA